MTEVVIQVRRNRAVDEKPVNIQFYTPFKISANQALTNEGFLLCKNVPIGRTGEMLYTRDDLPFIAADKEGIVRIARDDDEVFRAETLASFEGKPVTIGHPPVDVTPENWKELAVGIVQNVRRGEGMDSDCLVADLLVTDKEAIAAIRDGKDEVSCGYDADYQELDVGRGRQFNIIGNHVALVEQGRAGSRCAIRDRSSIMATKPTLKDRILGAFKLQDEKSLSAALEELNTADNAAATHVHVHMKDGKGKDEDKDDEKDDKKTQDAEGDKLDAILDLLQKLVGKTGDEDKEDDKDDKKDDKETKDKKGRDSALSLQDFLARAELIMPGYKAPTHDAAAKDIGAFVGAQMREVLKMAFATKDGHALLKPFVGEQPNFAVISADTADVVFVGASELAGKRNNDSMTTGAGGQSASGAAKVAASIADINKRHAEFWAKRA